MIKISYIEEKEDCAIINIDSPKHGHFDILIDLEDMDRCKDITWSIQKIQHWKDKNCVIYYATNRNKGMLHRYLMNTPKGVIVDHKDGNTYNNRKDNLRICNYTENNRNARLHTYNKNGHKGVIWYPYRNVNKWMAYICVDTKRITLGYFDKIEDAINIRKEAEEKYFGEYARQIK